MTGTLPLANGGTNASLSGANQIAFMNSGNTALSTSANLIYTGTQIGFATTTPWGAISVVSNLNPGFVMATSSGLTATFAVENTGGIRTSASQPGTTTTQILDWSQTPPQVEYQIGSGAFTITFINATTSQYWGSRKIVWVCNPHAAAGGALTWNAVEWIGTAPTQTTTLDNCDVYSFDITRATSTSAYKIAGTAGTGFK